ncbi:hypothetical protein, partial [Paenibacillus sp. y28]|uniref:hypothetical protein n=1 Tax=Paenibacillus sp. y28 TaxID=3129110 RepID=UPI00301B1A3B
STEVFDIFSRFLLFLFHIAQGCEMSGINLQRAEILLNTTVLDEQLIYQIINDKKHSLMSSDEEDKKQVLQEYVHRIVIQPSKDINNFEVEITYRVFSNGGEPCLCKTTIRRYYLHPNSLT